MFQLTLDSAILETILERATSAARLVGYIDEPAVNTVVRPLADTIDEIVHTVTELLGNPHLIAAPVPSARSTFAPDVVARDNFITRVGGPESVAPAARDDEARRAALVLREEDLVPIAQRPSRRGVRRRPDARRDQVSAVTAQDSPAGERARLRGYLERLLGWDDAPAVEHALRSVDLAATHQAALVLCGDGDLVQVARGLHRRVLGDKQPFVLCDPRRRGTAADAPLENHTTGMAALGAATGGSVCMRSKRLPRDFAELAAVLREPGARVQLIICGPRPPDRTELVLAPIKIPALSARHHELDRIVDEYARDAAVALRSSSPFTAIDRDWVRTHSGRSLPEIEKGAWRTVALHETGSIARAAALLGMGHTSLGEWFGHRRTKRSVRERDGPDSLAATRRILRSARALRQGLHRQRKAM